MCVKICSLSSGSRGNSVFVGTDNTKILIDNGLPVSYIENALLHIDIKPSELDAIIVTHRHSDHISGIGSFSKKYDTKIYAYHSEADKIAEGSRAPYENIVDFFDGDFYLKDFTVSPFKVEHDVVCFGYSLYHKGKKISIVTDLGRTAGDMLRNIGDSDIVMIEANHDDELLFNNDKYSPWLKNRIKSARGHLSNRECAEACVRLTEYGTREIILAHLSEENNYPELAFSAVSNKLSENGITEGLDVKISVARQHVMSPLFKVG